MYCTHFLMYIHLFLGCQNKIVQFKTDFNRSIFVFSLKQIFSFLTSLIKARLEQKPNTNEEQIELTIRLKTEN